MENATNNIQNVKKEAFKISRLEVAGMLVFLLVGCLVGPRYAQGFIAWDDLYYMHTSWSLSIEPIIINRYFHVYLLKFFTLLANNNPFYGARLLGAFISTVTITLVYLSARILAKAHQFWYGVFAVLFLLSYQLFAINFGSTLPDFTVAMMFAIGITLYLLYQRKPAYPGLLIFLFGFVLYLTFKTKETGLVLGVLIPGFLISEDQKLTVHILLRKLSLILFGFGAGAILIIFLNGVVLKDVFFGIRPSDIRTWLSFNSQETYPRVLDNYLNVVAPSAQFLLALIWALKPDPRFNFNERLIWLLSIGSIIFLDLSLIRGSFNVILRYAIPSVVILSVLAPQVLRTDLIGSTWKDRLRLGLIIAGCVLLACLGAVASYYLLARSADWSMKDYMNGIIVPMVLCLGIAWLALSKRNHIPSMIIILLCFGVITFPSAAWNISSVYSRNQPYRSSLRFQPFAEFNPIVICTSGRILVSGNIYEIRGYLSRDLNSSWWMFDLNYRCHTQKDQFTYSKTPLKVLDLGYEYVFLDVTDFKILQSDTQKYTNILSAYSVYPASNQETILLSRKP